ncbi:hypothetical protein BY996DRAFT_6814795 [Phakopsora pachyrhizi]|nr:hypothetical protein BY996DRAFT_6814795 [Phakopsora pachyrhizi]
MALFLKSDAFAFTLSLISASLLNKWILDKRNYLFYSFHFIFFKCCPCFTGNLTLGAVIDTLPKRKRKSINLFLIFLKLKWQNFEQNRKKSHQLPGKPLKEVCIL